MAFLDPTQVKCENCGTTQSHPFKDLLSYAARCAECAGLLESAGRWIHRVRLENALFATKVDLTLQIEDEFGVVLDDSGDHILDSVDLRQFVDRVVCAATELESMREAVWSYSVSYMRGCVSPEKAEKVESDAFSNLLSSGLEQGPPAL